MMNTKSPNDDDYADDLQIDDDLGSLDDLDDPSWDDQNGEGGFDDAPARQPAKKKKSSLFGVLIIGAGLLAAVAVVYLQFGQSAGPAAPPQAEVPAAPQDAELAQPQEAPAPVDAPVPGSEMPPAAPTAGEASMFEDAAAMQAQMAAPAPQPDAPAAIPDMAAAEQPRPPEAPGSDMPAPVAVDVVPSLDAAAPPEPQPAPEAPVLSAVPDAVPASPDAAVPPPELAAVPDAPPAPVEEPPVETSPAPPPAMAEEVAAPAPAAPTEEPAAPAAPEAVADSSTADTAQKAMDARLNELEQKIMARIDSAMQSSPSSSAGVSSDTLARLESTLSALSSRLDKIEDAQKELATRRAAEQARPAPVLSREPAATTKRQSVASAVIWDLRAAQHGQAWVSRRGQSDLKQVRVGDTLDGIGTITDILSHNGRWVVTGTGGSIRQ